MGWNGVVLCSLDHLKLDGAEQNSGIDSISFHHLTLHFFPFYLCGMKHLSVCPKIFKRWNGIFILLRSNSLHPTLLCSVLISKHNLRKI